MKGRPPKKPPGPFVNRIFDLRAAAKWSQEELGRRAGGMSGNLISRFERGEQAPDVYEATAIADALGVSVEGLLKGGGRRMVTVRGYVGAGHQVFPIDDNARSDGLYEVPCPVGMDPEFTVAAEVRGTSMLPIEEGWVLFYSRKEESVPSDVIGRLCVVKVANDGPTLVKRPVRGSTRGRFHLLSTNAEPIFDQELEWAARVRAVAPKLDAEEAA